MNMRKLPILATAGLGWLLLLRDWLSLIRIIWLPLGILVALDFVVASAWEEANSLRTFDEEDYPTSGIRILIDLDTALAVLFGGLMAALWHRVQVADRRVLSVPGLLAAWRNIAALTVYWCGLILITVGLIWVFNSIMWAPARILLERLLDTGSSLLIHPVLHSLLTETVLQPAPAICAFLITGRLGLALWARPSGEVGASERAWTAGHGSGWRIATAIFAAILPVILLEAAMRHLYAEMGSVWYWFVLPDLSNLLQLFIGVGVISAAHRNLLENQPDAGSEETG
jgi:hypothetical protein